MDGVVWFVGLIDRWRVVGHPSVVSAARRRGGAGSFFLCRISSLCCFGFAHFIGGASQPMMIRVSETGKAPSFPRPMTLPFPQKNPVWALFHHCREKKRNRKWKPEVIILYFSENWDDLSVIWCRLELAPRKIPKSDLYGWSRHWTTGRRRGTISEKEKAREIPGARWPAPSSPRWSLPTQKFKYIFFEKSKTRNTFLLVIQETRSASREKYY